MDIPANEVNFDGIVGPTHNYSGLSYGNIASMKSHASFSNPKAAALQGLEKMKFLSDKGIPQAVLPPHERPYIPILRSLGFQGTDVEILQKAFQDNPDFFLNCCSSASMWTANAATISPSPDSSDKKVHFTAANLSSKFHRSIEAPFTHRVLRKIFRDPHLFVHHDPLPSGMQFADEGAANHNRFCGSYGSPGLQLFVYGRHAFEKDARMPAKFPARQTFEASQALARLHAIPSERVLFAQQNPKAIDEGVFHNDVVSVANQHVFLYHEEAFVNTPAVIKEIRRMMRSLAQKDMIFLKITEKQVSLKQAVSSYLFNSQIVSLSDHSMLLIAPSECFEIPAVRDVIDQIVLDNSNPIKSVQYLNLRESMANGGGPACLRLRVVLTEKEFKGLHQGVVLNDRLYKKLTGWVKKHYRDRLHPKDMADPALLFETRKALDELTSILNLGSIYPFQD